MKAPPRAIGILTGNHLCRNPRVLKEASCLANAGFNVEVLGAWVDPRLKAEDKELLASAPFTFFPVVDAESRSRVSRARRFVARLLTSGSRLALRATGLRTRWQLGAAVGALAQVARTRKFELAIAHSELALAVAADLGRSGFRVGVDFEDWFSEDSLPEARRSRPVSLLRNLEERLLRSGRHATCPSYAMSKALAETYNCPAPGVVYNAFPWSDRSALDGLFKDRARRSRPSIHWYSQTLGRGRGLEELVAALPHIRSDAEVHLRGRPAEGFEAWIRARIPDAWRERVYFHDLVANEALLSRISEHDIGLAGETQYCLSRDLTVTNKILHYLLAGLAVVASETSGQEEVAQQAPAAVSTYPVGNSLALAERINELLDSKYRLRAAQEAALQAAQSTFCWERQEARLVNMVQAALNSPARDDGRREAQLS